MKVIIIHGCPSDKEKAMDPETRTYDKHWIPWTKKQLEERGIEVETPLMPEPWSPNYENFKREFEKLNVDEDSILIGHSCGCAFLVTWLGETERKIKKLILVAPWKVEYKEDGSDKDFYEHPINPHIKDNVGEIIMFTSNTECEDGKKSLEILHKELGGKIISLDSRGHYIEKHMGTKEFPELIEAVIG